MMVLGLKPRFPDFLCSNLPIIYNHHIRHRQERICLRIEWDFVASDDRVCLSVEVDAIYRSGQELRNSGSFVIQNTGPGLGLDTEPKVS